MTYERPIVLVDMDDVLADFDGALEQQFKAADPSYVPLDRSLGYWLQDRTDDPAIHATYWNLKHEQGFFRNLPVIPGAVEGWQQIHDLGYQPRICTAPLLTNLYCAAEKLEWIDAHLGPKAADQAILDEEKWRYDAITLIDDRPDINGADRASWIHTVFDHPYNRSLDTSFRLEGWHDTQLPQLLARCAQLYDRLFHR